MELVMAKYGTMRETDIIDLNAALVVPLTAIDDLSHWAGAMSIIFAQLQVAGQGKQEADKIRMLQKGVKAYHPIRQCIAQYRNSHPLLNGLSFRGLVDYIDQRSGYFNQSAAESGYPGNVSDLVRDITAKIKAELEMENTTGSAAMVVTDKAAAARPHKRHKNNYSRKHPRQEDGKSSFSASTMIATRRTQGQTAITCDSCQRGSLTTWLMQLILVYMTEYEVQA
jgi:hypothetical protein